MSDQKNTPRQRKQRTTPPKFKTFEFAPPYTEDILLETDLGVVAGRLVSTDKDGHKFQFWCENPKAYEKAKVKRWMSYPQPEKNDNLKDVLASTSTNHNLK